MRFRLVVGLAAVCFAYQMSHAGAARLLVVEKGQQSLAIIDPATGTVIASVPEAGTTGHEVAASPDGKLAFVPIYGDSGVGKAGTDGSTMVVIDVAAHKLVGEVDFGHGVRPHLPVVGPKDGLLYITTELDQSVTIVDPKTLKIAGSIPTGQPESHMLALSHDGRRGYTANVAPGTVSVLDIKARKTIAVIPVAGSVQRISISTDDHWVFTSDQTKPQLAVIDTSTNKVKSWIPLPAVGYGSAPSPDGHWLLIALPEANKVAVIDIATMKVARIIDVPAGPQAVLVRPDGKRAYVSCEVTNQVAEIDLSNWKVTRLIGTGKSTDGMSWAAGD
jgi:DNA-binding beta-propeller fold protein YncE